MIYTFVRCCIGAENHDLILEYIYVHQKKDYLAHDGLGTIDSDGWSNSISSSVIAVYVFFHDRDSYAACKIKGFGFKALPNAYRKVKSVHCPLVDDRPRVLKSNGRKKQEKGGGTGISEAAKY